MDQNTTGAAAAVGGGARRGFHDVYGAHENDDDKHKRRRLTYHAGENAPESSSSSSSTLPSTSFLGFHLELLKSLYIEKVENDNNDDNDNISRNCAVAGTLSSQQQQQAETKEKWDDGPIDPSLWKMAESFLIQRSSLAKNKQEATRLQGIHQETVIFMEEGDSRLDFHKKNSTGVSTTDASVSPVQQYRRLHSPILSNASQYASPTNKAKSTARSTSFGIVSRLLQRRSKSANKAYQKQIHPFQPLLQQTCYLVKRLQDMLKVHKDAQLAKDQAATNELLTSAIMPSQSSQHQSTVLSGVKNDSLSSPSEDERCRLVRLQTKLKLWSLLAQDLNREIA
jgi:hypothetical protein